MSLCPKCQNVGIKSQSDLNIIANDGGSRHCNGCKRLYHRCIDGVKYGSPGPLMCSFCRDEICFIENYPGYLTNQERRKT